MEGTTTETSQPDALRNRVRVTLTGLSQTGALPSLPAAASAALAMACDPEVDADRLCRLIQTDVGLAARLLRYANSPVYARRSAAQTVRDAVLTLGLGKTCDVLVTACARHLYVIPQARATGLWEHALAVAVVAEEIARTTRRVPASLAFLPGLFHDVGRIAFLLADSAAFTVIERIVESGEGTAVDLEREWYGFDHGEAGSVLASEWGLAGEQCEAIRAHHGAPAQGRAAELAAVIRAADDLAWALGYRGGPGEPSRTGLDALGFSSDDEAACAARCTELLAVQRALLG
jgi:putative nucleotidyltransferase with HDIG domain